MPVDCRVRLWHPRNDKKKTALGSRIILGQAWDIFNTKSEGDFLSRNLGLFTKATRKDSPP
jgi:hypothetical protein